MAREYARVKVKIWAESDFRLLTDGAQGLYFRLISSPTMNLAGVADWRPRRLAALTSGMTPELVCANAAELTAHRFVVVDDDTEEILVRSFVRHDGLIKTPNIAAAMVKDYAGVASSMLRGVIVHELHRLRQDDPEMSGWSVAKDLLSHPRIDPSSIPSPMASPMTSGNGSTPNPSGNPSPMAYPIPSGNGSHIPQPSSLIQQPASLSPHHAKSRHPADEPTLVAEIVASGDSAFDDFWELYPKKVGKGSSRNAWAKAIKRTHPRRIVEALPPLVAAWALHDPQFTPNPATWLNRDGWDDEPVPPPRGQDTRSLRQQDADRQAQLWKARSEAERAAANTQRTEIGA